MNKKNEKPEKGELSQADIQKFLIQQLAQQKGKTVTTKKVNPFIRFGNWALKKCEKSVYYLDRFTNFVIKKHDPDRNDVMQTARYPILFGTWVTLIFVVIGGIWSATAPLDSAATAIGTVIVSTNKQIVTHPGGVIKRIFVKQGEYVIDGQPLIELDETQLNVNYQTYLNYYRTILATEARLIAERDNSPEIQFSEFLLAETYKPEVAKIINTQVLLFNSRREAFNGMVESYLKKIEQTKQEAIAMRARKEAVERTLEITTDRFKATQQLHKQGFAQKSVLLDVERQLVSIQSEVASTASGIARLEQEINREEIELFSKKSEYLSKIMQELKENQMQLAETKEKFYAAKEALSHAIIRSPVEGVVNEIHYHTIGSVIPQGHPVAEITPYKGNLIIEAKIPQKDIESIRVGLKARMRFSAFKSRTTPMFTGTVVSLTSDTVQDRRAMSEMNNHMMGDDHFYVAHIEIDMEEFNKVAKKRNLKLHPGMKAEIQIVRGTRTLIQYLLDPVTDNMFRAFKEK